MVAEKLLEWEKDFLKLRGKRIELSDSQEKLWNTIKRIFEDSKYGPPIISKLAETIGQEPGTIKTVLDAKVNTG